MTRLPSAPAPSIPARPDGARRPARALPPLDYLLAFEAAALESSFAAAGKRLHLSETAISRKVRLLEAHYDLAFFERHARSIALTGDGGRYLARIRPALDLLREASAATARRGADEPVVLAATQSVAALWLAPRLHGFRQANPHLRIMLVASDDDDECLRDGVDLAILRGDGAWPGRRATRLFPEVIFPVCSPAFLAAHPEAATLAALPSLPLIEVVSGHPEWMDWRRWLGHQGVVGVELDRTTLFNLYAPAIHAAAEGVGVALGWGTLVDPLLAEGRLVRPLGDREVRTPQGYDLLSPVNHALAPPAREVEAWLRSTC